jgi:HSP20 family protein
MNLSLRPSKSLSRLFSDWLHPDSLTARDFFNMEPSFYPLRVGVNIPSVNIDETPQEYKLEVAAPGLERKDFNIKVEGHELTISAEKEEEKKEEKKVSDGYSRKEYSYNSFSRSFTLPENVKEENIDAKYDNGILTIHVPKAKETQVKPALKIPVN